MLFRILFILLVSSFPLFSETKEEQKDVELAKISEAFGHLIGKNIDTLGVKFDIAQVIKGLQDASSGKNSPMSEQECIEAISAAQEVAHQELAKDNLAKADQFLKKNGKQSKVVTVEKGKLQYKVEKKGAGEAVKADSHPVIHYVGKYLDGEVFGSSDQEEVISLEETIPGFSKGLVGMKEGEKRTLFIHPDYGYGTQGYLPPNSLLTFEIECVKANAPAQESETSENQIVEESSSVQ